MSERDFMLLARKDPSRAAVIEEDGRVWTRGDSARTPFVTRAIRDGLAEIADVAAAMRAYSSPPPVGQWEWAKDAEQALKYREWITSGWSKYGEGAFNGH